jgi:hypothetical protein
MKTHYKKTLFWTLVALIPTSVAVLLVRNPSNIAQTRPDHPDPGLRTRRYPGHTDLLAIRRTVEETISSLATYGQSWRLAGTTPATDPAGGFTVRAEVPVLLYTDDLEVRVQADENGTYWLVHVHSQSRVGKSDLGENCRHVKQLLKALDEKLSESGFTGQKD